MEMIVSQNPDTPTVAVMRLRGALDGSSYENFVAQAEKLYRAGTRSLILDMSELTFLSSAGLSGLHRVARLYRGDDPATFEEGWGAIHAMGKERGGGLQKQVKLLNPSEKTLDVLDTVGFRAFFEVYTDPQAALASFQ